MIICINELFEKKILHMDITNVVSVRQTFSIFRKYINKKVFAGVIYVARQFSILYLN